MSPIRDAKLDRIAGVRTFDVIVLGGGINGIGVFADLSLQGVSVLLVEANDFCSGCSAAPSRMIHGGLRYLENGEFRLVKESLRERDRLLRNAPHLVRPLPTTIPIEHMLSGLGNAAAGFLGFTGRPRPRGALPIKLGLALYDGITGAGRILPRHGFRGARATRRIWPALRRDIRFSATYHDAWISHPERLGIELVADAEGHNPEALALNHAQLTADGDRFLLEDRESGRCISVGARCLVNATGAWVDQTAAVYGASLPGRLVSGTKGSHLILDNPDLLGALAGHMIYFEHEDGRVCIVFPYLGRVLAGSTDIRVDRPGRTACTVEERDYILDALARLFPGVGVDARQVVYSYSGIRPLPESTADFTGRISRGHSVRRLSGPVPQYCMIGGKWTTFRAFAEDTVDLVLRDLGLPRRTSTADRAIGGGQHFKAGLAPDLALRHGMDRARADHLVDLYGSRAEAVATFCAGRNDRPLPGVAVTEAEVIHAVRHEYALHLADVLQRRTPLAIRGELSLAVVEATAMVMADECGWTTTRRREEVARFLAELDTFHGVQLSAIQGATG